MEAKSSLANSGGEVVARFTMMLTLRASAGLRVPTRGRGRCGCPEAALLDAGDVGHRTPEGTGRPSSHRVARCGTSLAANPRQVRELKRGTLNWFRLGA